MPERIGAQCSEDGGDGSGLQKVCGMCTRPRPHHPVTPQVCTESFCFLCTIITQNLQWDLNIRSLTKKAYQRMYLLRQLRKLNLPKAMMVTLYTAMNESILCCSITIRHVLSLSPLNYQLQAEMPKKYT